MQAQADEHGLGMKVDEIPVVFDCKILAKILGVSHTTAHSIMQRPDFPVWRLSSKKHRIYKAKFLEWLEKQIEG